VRAVLGDTLLTIIALFFAVMIIIMLEQAFNERPP